MLLPVRSDIFLLDPFGFPPSRNIEQQNAGYKFNKPGGEVQKID